eukprot:c20023_g1_i1 orf=186-1202(+)
MLGAHQAEAMAPRVVMEFMNLKIFSDGSLLRSPPHPPLAPSSHRCFVDGVATEDVSLSKSHGVWARLYLPEICGALKLPVLVYFHGGGFCDGSTALPKDHRFLCKLARSAEVLIVSVDYRLCPEHRLPAAFDDCFDALVWVQSQAEVQLKGGGNEGEPWLVDRADFSRCFLGGDSAGANITHHLALRAAGRSWAPLHIEGMILIHPFFGGEERNATELKRLDWTEIVDKVWKFSLPESANCDDPACNPLSRGAPSLSEISLPCALVAVASEDFFKERGVRYYEALLEAGKDAKLFISDNEDHEFHLDAPPESENALLFLNQLIDFVHNQDTKASVSVS